MSDEEVIPLAYGDESGERWCVEGHVPPSMAALAVLVCEGSDGGGWDHVDAMLGDDPRREAMVLVECTRHAWLYLDEDRDGLFPCDKDRPGAMAYTLVEV